MIEEPTRRGAVLNFVLTNKVVRCEVNMKLKSILGCSDHEAADFKVLGAVRTVGRRSTTLDYKRADFGIFKDLFSRVPWDRTHGREEWPKQTG